VRVPIRLALVDDHPALIRGLASLFEGDEYEVVGSSDCSSGLIDLVRRSPPDVLITDLSMPGDVFEAIREASHSGTRVVVFTAYSDTSLAVRAFQAGALAFVLKGRPSEDLFDAIRSAIGGQIYVSPGFAPRMLAALRPDGTKSPEDLLSVRERQIVDGLLRAKTNKEIARELNLSEKTIKHYMTNLMAKLGAKNRLDVVLAMQSPTSNERELMPGLDPALSK